MSKVTLHSHKGLHIYTVQYTVELLYTCTYTLLMIIMHIIDSIQAFNIHFSYYHFAFSAMRY